jgi:hypothetical protein
VKVFPSWKKNQAMVILVDVLKLFFSSWKSKAFILLRKIFERDINSKKNYNFNLL